MISRVDRCKSLVPTGGCVRESLDYKNVAEGLIQLRASYLRKVALIRFISALLKEGQRDIKFCRRLLFKSELMPPGPAHTKALAIVLGVTRRGFRQIVLVRSISGHRVHIERAKVEIKVGWVGDQKIRCQFDNFVSAVAKSLDHDLLISKPLIVAAFCRIRCVGSD
jgi:hypothetical protein